MQVSRDPNTLVAHRRILVELLLLSIVFLIPLVLFGVSIYFFPSRETGKALQNGIK